MDRISTSVSSISGGASRSKKRTADHAQMEAPENVCSKRIKIEGNVETSASTRSPKKRTIDDAQIESSNAIYPKRVKTESDADDSINEQDWHTSFLSDSHRPLSGSHIKQDKSNIPDRDPPLQPLDNQPEQEQLEQEDLNKAGLPPLTQWANPKLSFRDLEASGAASRILQPSNNLDAFKVWLERRYVPNHADKGSPLLQYLLEASEEMPDWEPQFTRSWDYLTVFLNPHEDRALHEARYDKQLVYQCSLGEEPLYEDVRPRDDEYGPGGLSQPVEHVVEIVLEPEIPRQLTPPTSRPRQQSGQSQALSGRQRATKKPRGQKGMRSPNEQYTQHLRSGARSRKLRSGGTYSAPRSGHVQLGWTGRQERYETTRTRHLHASASFVAHTCTSYL